MSPGFLVYTRFVFGFDETALYDLEDFIHIRIMLFQRVDVDISCGVRDAGNLVDHIADSGKLSGKLQIIQWGHLY